MVSVPLRGYGFEIRWSALFATLEKVSVPLRGYGFEIADEIKVWELLWEFPSPCGDMVLKF